MSTECAVRGLVKGIRLLESVIGFLVTELFFFGLRKVDRADYPLADVILKIYEQSADERAFELYSNESIFEDPFLRVKGRTEIRRAFEAIKLIASSTRIVRAAPMWRTNQVLSIYNIQEYTLLTLPIRIFVPSRIDLTFGDNGKLITHLDHWFYLPLMSSKILGIFTTPLTLIRTFNGYLVSKLQDQLLVTNKLPYGLSEH